MPHNLCFSTCSRSESLHTPLKFRGGVLVEPIFTVKFTLPLGFCIMERLIV